MEKYDNLQFYIILLYRFLLQNCFLHFYIDARMYDKIKLLEILLHSDFRTIDDSDKPFAPSTEIYCVIAEKMKQFNCNISSKCIYVIINENRSEYKNKILKIFNIKGTYNFFKLICR